MNLEELGFSKLTYSEVILTIKHKEKINSAPMGIILNNEGLRLKVYKGQRTYGMIINGAKDCVLNITDDPVVFYNAIFEKDKILYCPSKCVSSPRICDCNAYVECSITQVTKHEGYIEVLLNPLIINATRRMIITFNRAVPAIIEALICYSKIPHFKNIDMKRAESLMKRIAIFRDIVYHSTKNKTLREIVTKILQKSKETLFPNES